MENLTYKICQNCNSNKIAEGNFQRRTRKGITRYDSCCNQCRKEIRETLLIGKTTNKRPISEEKNKLNQDRTIINQEFRNIQKAAQQRFERANNVNVEKYILQDTRRADKKKGFICDLDLGFVKQLIDKPCTYCCDPKPSKMTLDRIDNSKGHTKDNVVQACYRCNLFRRDMPYEAWLYIAPVMKQLRENGLLDNWHKVPFARSSISKKEEQEDKIKEIKEKKQNIETLYELERVASEQINDVNPNNWQKATDEQLKEALHKHDSIANALKSLNMAPKGKNYERVKKVLGIPLDQKLPRKANAFKNPKS